MKLAGGAKFAGAAQKYVANDFTVGDSTANRLLNTAGFRWLRRSQGQDTANGDGNDTNRNQYNVRLDHNFNSNNKIFFTGTREWDISDTQIAPWPGGYGGVYTLVSDAPPATIGIVTTNSALLGLYCSLNTRVEVVGRGLFRAEVVLACGGDGRRPYVDVGNDTFVGHQAWNKDLPPVGHPP